MMLSYAGLILQSIEIWCIFDLCVTVG